MIGLILNELLRFWYRRAIRWLVAVVLAGLTLAGVVVFFSASGNAPDAGAIERQAEASRQRCIEANSGFELPPGQTPESVCSNFTADVYRYDYNDDPRFCPMSMLTSSACDLLARRTSGADARHVEQIRTFDDLMVLEQFEPTDSNGDELGPPISRGYTRGYLVGLGVLALIVAALVGSTFAGAEYRAGTIESTLVVEPRRWRVLVARFLAGTVGAALITLLLLGFHLLTLVPTLLSRADTDAVLPGFWGAVVRSIAVAAALSGLVALVAMAVTTLAKNTVGGVGGVLGYLVGSQIVVFVIVKSLRPVELVQNAFAVLANADVTRYEGVRGFSYEQEVMAHGPGTAALYVAAYAALVTGLSAVVFLRRDID